MIYLNKAINTALASELGGEPGLDVGVAHPLALVIGSVLAVHVVRAVPPPGVVECSVI